MIVAPLLAGVAAWLLVATPSHHAGLGSGTPVRQDARRAFPRPVAALAVCAAASIWVVGPQHLVLVVVAAGAGLGVAALVERRHRRRAAAAAADRVLEGCAVLADELRSGRSPEAALALAARTCPELEGAVRASALGADVPTALRARGYGAGAGAHASVPVPDLRLVAAAWQVAHRTGDGLGEALTRVAAGLRAGRATRRVVEAELASARATARLLVALPGLALLAGAGAGGRPWLFLTSTAPGLVCLVAGAVLTLAGLWWIEAIADDVERGA